MFNFPYKIRIAAFDGFLWGWFGGALAATVIPLITFGAARIMLYKRLQNDNQDDDQNNNEDQYVSCKWYQWGCNNNDDQDQAENENQDQTTPWWWFFGSEDQRRRRDEEGRCSPALVLAYCWTLVLFMSILYFGYRELKNMSDLNRVSAALAVFANTAFVTMILLAGVEGAIETEGRELEERGFYSQFGVMMFLTNLFWLVHAVTFAVLFHRRAYKNETTQIEVDETDYQIHADAEKPGVTV